MADHPQRPRHLYLVGLLTFASGCVDAVTLTVIGGAFTSVITGNLILIGRGIGTTTLEPALHAVMAVAGYVAGVAIGSRLAHLAARSEADEPRPDWPRRATIVLGIECLLLIAVNAGWIGYQARPPAAATDLLLVVAGVCLGMQGAAARTIAGNPSTTYMTGALTGLVEALATGQARKADPTAALGLATLVVGAACGAVLIRHARPAALLPALAAIALVVLIKGRHHRAELPPDPASG
ncbi:MAG TPA: YoaK family protein [Streptosporangiaceae bacterium]|nr:YoaK family protein [Streptosporangiaceae bacterium]